MPGDSTTPKMKNLICLKLELLWKSCLYNFHTPNTLTETNNFAHDKWMVGRRLFPFFLVPGLLAGGELFVFRECNKPESNLFFKLEILPRDPGMVPKKPLFWRINSLFILILTLFIREF